eukprot:7311105-Pyramimonas_sp.AAC.1
MGCRKPEKVRTSTTHKKRRAIQRVSLLSVLLGPWWAILGLSWAVLGPFWAVLGAFGLLRAFLGASWGPIGSLMGPTWGALLGEGTEKALQEFACDDSWHPSLLGVLVLSCVTALCWEP